ncbi:hypothetical protein B0J13DRAFT_604747 [Dactylonectria estremocensis]|uniref:Uncharacterized protein n=1 Tax=Dactylonectria estremocensis TaxID=1079267 RepID=A0A9P9JDA0_9HYPO|nr:hypothetical protein B0J13DRAFT_604747 [Dactylonectria estremocensis]
MPRCLSTAFMMWPTIYHQAFGRAYDDPSNTTLAITGPTLRLRLAVLGRHKMLNIVSQLHEARRRCLSDTGAILQRQAIRTLCCSFLREVSHHLLYAEHSLPRPIFYQVQMRCPVHCSVLHDNKHRAMSSNQFSGPHPGGYNWHQPILSAESAVNESVMSQWEDELDGTILQIFQLIPEGSPRLYYQAKELEVICPPHVLQELKEGGMDFSSHLIAWLDERSRSGVTRKGGGWLTRADLYAALRVKRLQIDSRGEGNPPNADRRLVYLPNPDWRGLSPIILTSSSQQAPILSTFLWKHITADCSIQASFPISGRTFTLEFHLPFFVWKNAKTVLRDKRVRSDKSPLRKSRALAFLKKCKTGLKEDDALDYLHESQWSCVVTGFNNSVWSAHGFTDTYFYEADDQFDRSSTNHYARCMDEEEVIYWDPIIGSDANLPVMDPREYFVATLRNCTKGIIEEWTNIITRLERMMGYYIDDEDIFLDDDKLAFRAADDHSKTLQESYMWTKKVSILLEQLRKRIRNHNTAWESFKATDIHYFSESRPQSEAPNRTIHLLHSNDTSMADLKTLEVRLRDLCDKNEGFRRSLELYLQVENNRTIVLQQFNINFIQIISPPALAASMMQSNVLPWKSGFLPWLIISGVLWAMMAMVRPALAWYHRTICKKPSSSLTAPLVQDATVDGFHWQPDDMAFPLPTFARHRAAPFTFGNRETWP